MPVVPFDQRTLATPASSDAVPPKTMGVRLDTYVAAAVGDAMATVGGAASTDHVYAAGDGSTFPAASIART